jgi:hypothetical protein
MIFHLVYFLFKKDSVVEHTFFAGFKMVNVTGAPGCLWQILLLHDICILFFTYVSYREPALQVYISPSQFSTVNGNVKQISECIIRRKT